MRLPRHCSVTCRSLSRVSRQLSNNVFFSGFHPTPPRTSWTSATFPWCGAPICTRPVVRPQQKWRCCWWPTIRSLTFLFLVFQSCSIPHLISTSLRLFVIYKLNLSSLRGMADMPRCYRGRLYITMIVVDCCKFSFLRNKRCSCYWLLIFLLWVCARLPVIF